MKSIALIIRDLMLFVGSVIALTLVAALMGAYLVAIAPLLAIVLVYAFVAAAVMGLFGICVAIVNRRRRPHP